MKKARSFAVLVGAGLVGVLSLWPTLDGAVALVAASDPERMPSEALLRGLLLLQPALLLALATAAGITFAPRLGLRSIMVERVNGHVAAQPVSLDVGRAALGGLIGCAIIVAGDLMFAALDPAAFDRLHTTPSTWPEALLTGALYGGLTEEIITRWGLMSLLAWGLTKLSLRQSAAIASAMGLSALLFAAGHLPALAASLDEPSPVVIVRTLVLNTAAGIVFGWLFWRRNLETAMLAHAATHLLLFGARYVGIAS